MTKQHINKGYESELKQVQSRLETMTNHSHQMIKDAIRSLVENNKDLARKVIMFDRRVDSEEKLIDHQCIDLLARRQPLAADLRLIIAIIKMVTYVERLADLAVKIAKRVLKLKNAHEKDDIQPIESMAKSIRLMLNETLKAFLLKEHKRAQEVIKKDTLIDEMYHECSRYYIKKMGNNETSLEHYYHLLSIAKWLERMGDHCTNLAELTIYMIKGEDIRHPQAKELT